MPSVTLNNGDQTTGRVKDDATSAWHPAAISDRVLLDLQDRLERVQRLGGAFADIELSPQMKDRLQELRRAGSRKLIRK